VNTLRKAWRRSGGLIRLARHMREYLAEPLSAVRAVQFHPDDFNDPAFRAEGAAQTGGASGPPMRFGWSFALSAQWAPHWCVFFAANNRLGAPLIFWSPRNSGAIGPQLACAKFQQRLDRWFVSQEMTHLADRFYARSRHWICRAARRLSCCGTGCLP